jgi:hypothetical protein
MEIAVNETLLGMVTATGTLLDVVLIPSPQQYAVPVVARAQVESVPAAIAVNETPLGMVTAIGPSLLDVVPLPSAPL